MDGTSQKWRFGSDDNLRLFKSSSDFFFLVAVSPAVSFSGVYWRERLLSVLGH